MLAITALCSEWRDYCMLVGSGKTEKVTRVGRRFESGYIEGLMNRLLSLRQRVWWNNYMR